MNEDNLLSYIVKTMQCTFCDLIVIKQNNEDSSNKRISTTHYHR